MRKGSRLSGGFVESKIIHYSDFAGRASVCGSSLETSSDKAEVTCARCRSTRKFVR